MSEPESLRSICQRKINEWHQKRDQQQFAQMVEQSVLRRPEMPLLSSDDKGLLSSMGIAW